MASGRTRVLIGVVAVALLAGFIGWFAGRQVRSPAQIAAETAPPPASLITVPVESRTLSRDVVTRADATYGDAVDVVLVPDATSGRDQVVTGRVPSRDQELFEGSVMIEIAGRPVFLLEGDLPTFRSLGPGDSGVDVEQLEGALARLGFLTTPPNDFYDQSTEDAISAMYRNSGYSPPEITDGELERLKAAETAVDMAEDAVQSAQDAVDDLTGSGSTQATGAVPVSALAARWNDEVATGDDSSSDGDATNSAATNPVFDAEQQLADAAATYQAAQQRYDVELANARAQFERGSLSRKEYDSIQLELTAEFNAAERAYATALGEVNAVGGNPVVGSAGSAASGIEGTDGSIEGTDGTMGGAGGSMGGADGSIEGTDGSIEGTDDSMGGSGGIAPPGADVGIDGTPIGSEIDTSGASTSAPVVVQSDGRQARRALERARTDLTEAQTDLAEVQSEVGISLPQSEFFFLSNLPRIVTDVMVEPGDTVDGPVMTISGGGLMFSGGIASISRPYVEVGDAAVADDEGTGTKVEVTITELADNPGTDGETDDRFYFEATPKGDVDSDALTRIGNFRITIPIERTEGEVIAVPLAALSAAPDGSSRVEVERSPGTTEFVDVIVGLEAEGYVEITPVEAGQVTVDDLVVVGVERVDAEE